MTVFMIKLRISYVYQQKWRKYAEKARKICLFAYTKIVENTT